MIDKVLDGLQRASKERHVDDIKDFLFIEVPKGRLSKPKKYDTKRNQEQRKFEQKQLRIKQIAEQVNSKL